MRQGLLELTLAFLALASPALAQCIDADQDGAYRNCGTPHDCNDAAPSTHPGAFEACDGYDNDCNGALDEGCTQTCGDPLLFAEDRLIADLDAYTSGPSLVWTGSEYGVAWAVERNFDWEIMFARLDASGHKIGEDLRVTPGAFPYLRPALVWTGSVYGLAWVGRDTPGVFFARLDAEGNRIGGERRVTSYPGVVSGPSLAWTGVEFGLVWAQYSAEGIVFARLDAEGFRLGGHHLTHNSLSDWPSLIWTGTSYGVAWSEGGYYAGTLYFARLTAAGNVIGGPTRVADAARYTSLVWNGDGYALAWEEVRDAVSGAYFAPFDSAGVKIGEVVLVTQFYDYTKGPDLAWSGTEYGLVWTERRDEIGELYFARLGSDGTRIGDDLAVSQRVVGHAYSPALVWTGRSFGVAWEMELAALLFDSGTEGCDEPDADGDGAPAHVDCDEADATLFPGAPQLCDGKNNDCSDPSWFDVPADELEADGDGVLPCAGDCNRFLAAVHLGATETCDGLDNDCDGTIDGCGCDLDGDGFGACDGDCNAADSAAHPGATETCDAVDNDCDGAVDGSACAPSCEHVATFAAVAPLDPARPNETVLVWNGSGYGVVWHSVVFDGSDHLSFLRLDGAGDPIGTEVRITEDSATLELEPRLPALVWTGDGYGVVWLDHGDSWSPEIYFARLDATGAKIGPQVRLTFGLIAASAPTLAWNGEEFAVAWADYAFGDQEIWFQLLDAGGTLIGPAKRVTNSAGESSNPSLVRDSSGWAIAWADGRAGTVEAYFARLDGLGNKLGTDRRITTSSGVLEEIDTLELRSGDGGFGLAWSTASRRLRWARLDASGAITASEPVTDGEERGYDLAWSGTEYALAWATYPPVYTNGKIGVTRFDPSGARIGSELVVLDNPSYFEVFPVLAWNGAEYGLAWGGPHQIELRFTRVGCCQPSASEVCNALDDDCDGSVDEDAQGEDTDGDGMHNLCDNCPAAFNSGQVDDDDDSIGEVCDNCPGVGNSDQADGDLDRVGDVCDNCIELANPGQKNTDGDALGDSCDNCLRVANSEQTDDDLDGAGNACDNCAGLANPGQRNQDHDAFGDDCDNCPRAWNLDQADSDLDGPGDACDNCAIAENSDQADGEHDGVGDVCDDCPAAFDPSQTDLDLDLEGDACDLDDGTVYLFAATPGLVEWQAETGYDTWNVYGGDLAELRASGIYTQLPGGLAWRVCGVAAPPVADPSAPPPGSCVFHLVTGVASGVEGSLGTNGAGDERPNANPCF